MNAITTFDFQELPVRALLGEDGEPWFIGRDVCTCLELANTSQAISRLEEDEKGIITGDTLRGAQKMLIVSEAGCYRLVFTSRTEKAEAFKRWLAHEVLPALRRTGRYVMGDDTAPAVPASLPAFDLEPAALSVALNAVREARSLWGKAAARALWLASPLPKVAAMYQDEDGVGPMADNSAARFVRDEIMPDPGGSLDADTIWRGYARWCQQQGESLLTQTALGRALSAAGIAKTKSGRISYRDVALAS